MAERNDKRGKAQQVEIEQIVTRAVAQALEDQLPQLQAQIVKQVLEALPAEESEGTAPTEQSSSLVQSVSNIHAGTTQKEVLRALLDAGSEHCSRIGLFVVRAGAASGWQGRGFGDE